MATNDYPRLCGGTFFTLLLQARKQRAKPRQHRQGERDGLSETDVLVKLIQVMNPDYTEPTSTMIGTFKSNTSDFKSCKISKSTYLPLSNTTAFHNRITKEYLTPFAAMCDFVEQVVEVGTSLEKDVQLAKALLELIELDASIADDQEFYVCENGSAMKKATLRSATDICLPAFLLGVWHFVLTNRPENTVGKETYETWCPSNGGAERTYIGEMGVALSRHIRISAATIKILPTSDDGNEEDESPFEYTDPIIEEVTHTPIESEEKKSLLEVFEDAIEEYHIDLFVDTDFTAMPLYSDAVMDVDTFVAYMRDQLRVFRRKQDSIYNWVIDFLNILEAYSFYMSIRMIPKGDGDTFCWLHNFSWSEAHEDILNYRRSLNDLYGLISGGQTLSVFGYFIPDDDADSERVDQSETLEDSDEDEQNRKSAEATAATQILNTPAVFINHGANGIQINNNGTLNIDRGGIK